MSDTAQEHIPELTLGWRLKMALGNMNSQAMADALEVSRTTVSRWMADRGAPPRRVFIKQWALMTRTDPTWLLTGQQSAPHPSESDEGLDVRREGLEPPTRCVIEALELVEVANVVPFPLWRTGKPDPVLPRRGPLTLVPATVMLKDVA